MTALLGLIAAVYGGSFVVIAAGGLLWRISPRFRREMVDQPTLR